MQALERRFPGLRGASWRKTSDEDPRYNCVAWAFQDTERWWWPCEEGTPPGYWPDSLLRDDSIECAVALFESFGYRRCLPGEVQTDDAVIILYGRSGRFLHVARRTAEGWWASKLGDLEDIEHELPDAAECWRNGSVCCWMRRARAG